jgi:hypothetical protein
MVIDDCQTGKINVNRFFKDRKSTLMQGKHKNIYAHSFQGESPSY